MRIYLVVVDQPVKALPYILEVVCHFPDEKVSSEFFVPGFLIEFDDIGIIKVANLFKASLVDVSLHIFVNFGKGFHLVDNLVANNVYIQLIVRLV